MNRTKAAFKAMRETLGMSQQLMADLLHVDVRSVKRWESPTAEEYKKAPDDAWQLLAKHIQMQEWTVETAVAQAEETTGELGEKPNEVSLAYWYNEEEYENAHPGEGKFWQMANVTSRRIASELRQRGYTVNFDFPGLKAIKEEWGVEDRRLGTKEVE